MKWYVTVLKKYAQFNGRAGLSEYWFYVLFNVIISIVLQVLGAASPLILGLLGLYALATLIPSLAVAVRRMHDVGKSGWYILIPIYNLILACSSSTPGPNQYGPEAPKTPEG